MPNIQITIKPEHDGSAPCTATIWGDAGKQGQFRIYGGDEMTRAAGAILYELAREVDARGCADFATFISDAAIAAYKIRNEGRLSCVEVRADDE